jgi:HK97 family phage prohead protease
MKIEIRADNSVHIEGYVNAVERDSNIINVPSVGRCVEQIRAGAFDQALSSGADVAILENHDTSRKLGSTSQGNLKLCEDNIGLRASADITDADIAGKARRGELKGWSFGFICTDSEIEQRAGNVPRRIVKGMTLSEVSLIDGAYKPCYNGTLVEVRSEGNLMEYRSGVEEPIETIIEERAEVPDYSYYDALLRYHELRYNPYHDPGNGRFTSGGGGGGGMLVVPKGQKGKGFYVGQSERDIAEQALANEFDEWEKAKQTTHGGQTAEETERIKSEIVDSINPKFAGIKRKAENGEGNWSWTKGEAASESEAQNMDHIWNVYDKGKYTVVDGSIGNKNVYFAADSSNPTVIKAKGIMAEREASRTERERKIARDSIETQGKSKTTTSTYDRWYSNNRKNFDAYWNAAQGNSRAEIDDDPDDPV